MRYKMGLWINDSMRLHSIPREVSDSTHPWSRLLELGGGVPVGPLLVIPIDDDMFPARVTTLGIIVGSISLSLDRQRVEASGLYIVCFLLFSPLRSVFTAGSKIGRDLPVQGRKRR